MDFSGGLRVQQVGLAWRNRPGQTTDRPRGAGDRWQFNLFHHAMLIGRPPARHEAPCAIWFPPREPQWYRGADGGFSDDWLGCSGPVETLLRHHDIPIGTPFPIGDVADIENCLLALQREQQERLPFSDEASTDLLRSLVRQLARNRSGERAQDPRHQAILRVRALLREHFAQDWTISRMAKAAGLGSHRFAVLYRRWCGCTPLHELTWFRIRHAQDLLRQGGSTVATVAKACGFADPLYFSRVFRRWTGMPPATFGRRG